MNLMHVSRPPAGPESDQSTSSSPVLGIDFGTTNSSVAVHTGHSVELLRFPAGRALTESFRSVLYFEQLKNSGTTQLRSFTGPHAIEQYLSAATGRHEVTQHRLIQSLKSYLASRTLTGTEVFGRRYTLEDLIARILTDLRLAAEQHFGQPIHRAVVGRPVRFVASESDADNAFALARLEAAFHQAGFHHVTFEFEPIAASAAYCAALGADQPTSRKELLLIGDFGGGTSDFSLIELRPASGKTPPNSLTQPIGKILANAGLGLAGDAFDARIVRKLVSPALGSASFERTFSHASDRPAPIIPAVPAWIYANLERWHYLSFLKTRNVSEILKSARARAEHPEEVAALITLIDEDLGYQLHQSVQRLKIALSSATEATFTLREGSLDLAAHVSRADFELWIADDLAAIANTIDGLLDHANLAPHQIDRVFLTGGTSLVPAVRRLFDTRFTSARVQTGNEFTSVAIGLALNAALQQNTV